MSKNQHKFSPESKPKGNYQNREGNDCFDMLDAEGVTVTEERLSGSLYMFVCPECHAHSYADSSYQKWLVQVEAYAAAIGFRSLQILGMACKPCHAVMDVQRLESEPTS